MLSFKVLLTVLVALVLLTLVVMLAASALEGAELVWVQAAVAVRAPVWTLLIQTVTFITSAVPCAIAMALLSFVQMWRAFRQAGNVRVQQVLVHAWPGVIFAGAIGSNIAMRIGVGRLSPQVEYLPTLLPEVYAGFHQFSFPSGHAGTALVTYGSFLMALWPSLKTSRQRWVACGAAGAVTLATGFGRVYLGVHWPTDVLGGYLLAAFWLVIGNWLNNARASLAYHS